MARSSDEDMKRGATMGLPNILKESSDRVHKHVEHVEMVLEQYKTGLVSTDELAHSLINRGGEILQQCIIIGGWKISWGE